MPRAFQAHKPVRSCTLQLPTVNETNKPTGDERGAPEGGEGEGKEPCQRGEGRRRALIPTLAGHHCKSLCSAVSQAALPPCRDVSRADAWGDGLAVSRHPSCMEEDAPGPWVWVSQSGGTALWLVSCACTHAGWHEQHRPCPRDAGGSAPICSFTALRSALLEMKQPLALERVS